MATPNQMPQIPKRPSKLRQQLLAALIETQTVTRTRRVFTKDEEGELVEGTVKESREALRFPLAQNLSEAAVDRLAERWL